MTVKLNPFVISVSFTDKGKNCKPLLQKHVIFYEETFSSKIKNIDSSFSKLVYSFHSTYQEREIEPSMKREKSYDYRRVKVQNILTSMIADGRVLAKFNPDFGIFSQVHILEFLKRQTCPIFYSLFRYVIFNFTIDQEVHEK